MPPLRFITYLSPSLPERLFVRIAERVAFALSRPSSLRVESLKSGPSRGERDPFTESDADVGFLCSPSFIWLRERASPPVELLPAPVFADVRVSGRPVYFSDVIVAAKSRALGFSDLRDSAWAYNDSCSLSGYYCLLQKFVEVGEDHRRAAWHCAGSHLESIRRVDRGDSDAAAIDSNVLRLALAAEPHLVSQLRVVESWGPFPVQPVVARASLPAGVKAAIAQALLQLGGDEVLRELGVERFVPVTDGDYDEERAALKACERFARADAMCG